MLKEDPLNKLYGVNLDLLKSHQAESTEWMLPKLSRHFSIAIICILWGPLGVHPDSQSQKFPLVLKQSFVTSYQFLLWLILPLVLAVASILPSSLSWQEIWFLHWRDHIFDFTTTANVMFYLIVKQYWQILINDWCDFFLIENVP